MKTRSFFASLLLIISLPLYAEGEILKVAVNHFSPPFVMESANKQLYGFDINVMESVCKNLKRSCKFVPMRFQDLIPAVANKKADVAVSSIFITPERSERVNFSQPYLLSNSMFLANKEKVKEPFRLRMLNNSTIGVEKGTIFDQMIGTLGIQNAKIVHYDNYEDEIEALRDNEVDFVLMDAPAALYWQIQSSGNLIALGKPLVYGFGVAVAVNKAEGDLLNQINKALQDYQNSKEYKENYDQYISLFSE